MLSFAQFIEKCTRLAEMKGKLFVPALPTSTFPLADADIRKERNGKVEGGMEGRNGRVEWKSGMETAES
jgi:hypothetical protein